MPNALLGKVLEVDIDPIMVRFAETVRQPYDSCHDAFLQRVYAQATHEH